MRYSFNLIYCLTQVSGDCRYLLCSIDFRLGTETFSCEGRTIIDPGFTDILDTQQEENERVPKLNENQMVDISQVCTYKDKF